MALKYKISVIEEKNSLIVYDCVGAYKYDNLTGYGKPNDIEVKNITSTIFYVTTPNLPKGSEPYKVDVSGNWPVSTDLQLGMEILPYQIGEKNNELTSGQYTIKAEISGTDRQGNAFKKTDIFAIICKKQIECCVDKAMKHVNTNAFKDAKQKATIELNNLLESVNYAIDCGLTNEAIEKIELINAQCGCCGC